MKTQDEKRRGREVPSEPTLWEAMLLAGEAPEVQDPDGLTHLDRIRIAASEGTEAYAV